MKIFFALLLGHNAALILQALAGPEGMSNQKCKVTCQRFGMKSLGPEFKDIAHPTQCMDKCDEVFPKDSAAGSSKSFLESLNPKGGEAQHNIHPAKGQAPAQTVLSDPNETPIKK